MIDNRQLLAILVTLLVASGRDEYRAAIEARNILVNVGIYL